MSIPSGQSQRAWPECAGSYAEGPAVAGGGAAAGGGCTNRQEWGHTQPCRTRGET